MTLLHAAPGLQAFSITIFHVVCKQMGAGSTAKPIALISVCVFTMVVYSSAKLCSLIWIMCLEFQYNGMRITLLFICLYMCVS